MATEPGRCGPRLEVLVDRRTDLARPGRSHTRSWGGDELLFKSEEFVERPGWLDGRRT